MKRNFFILLSLLVFCFAFFIFDAFVLAQSQGNLVIDTVHYEQEIQDLTAEYKNTLITYEKKTNEFNFAKLQYQQLQTLSSLEEAVVASRELFVIRDETLLRYTQILRLKLYSSWGIFLETKQDKIAIIDDLILSLEKHLEDSKKIENRDDLIARTVEFSSIGPKLQSNVDQIIPLFSLGKLQSTFDKTVLLTDKIEAQTFASGLSAAAKAEKKRGIQLIREKEAGMRTILKELNGPAILDKRGNVIESKSDSNTVYTGISQVLSFLEEILTN